MTGYVYAENAVESDGSLIPSPFRLLCPLLYQYRLIFNAVHRR